MGAAGVLDLALADQGAQVLGRVARLSGAIGEREQLAGSTAGNGVEVPEDRLEQEGAVQQDAALAHDFGFGGPLSHELVGSHRLLRRLYLTRNLVMRRRQK